MSPFGLTNFSLRPSPLEASLSVAKACRKRRRPDAALVSPSLPVLFHPAKTPSRSLLQADATDGPGPVLTTGSARLAAVRSLSPGGRAVLSSAASRRYKATAPFHTEAGAPLLSAPPNLTAHAPPRFETSGQPTPPSNPWPPPAIPPNSGSRPDSTRPGDAHRPHCGPPR